MNTPSKVFSATLVTVVTALTSTGGDGESSTGFSHWF